MQTDSTVTLPGFPTLLSAEGDFLIKAGSIHNTFNETTQSRRREDRRERKRRLTTSQRKDVKEVSAGKRQNKVEKKEKKEPSKNNPVPQQPRGSN